MPFHLNHIHASGELRDAFLAAVRLFLQEEATKLEPRIELLGELRTVSDLCGLLWTCTDALPRFEQGLLADELGPDHHALHTYAQAARALKRLVVTKELWPNLGDGGMREAAYRGG